MTDKTTNTNDTEIETSNDDEESVTSGSAIERTEVALTGPVLFRAMLTEDEIERLDDGENPADIIQNVSEWEPVGTAGDWEFEVSDT